MSVKRRFTAMILPKYNLQGIDPKKYHISLHAVRKVEEALRALFGKQNAREITLFADTLLKMPPL